MGYFGKSWDNLGKVVTYESMEHQATVSPTTSAYMNKLAAARYLNISFSLLNKLLKNKSGPPMFRFGALCRFRAEDLDRWASERQVQ
jgi:hypothetical protein